MIRSNVLVIAPHPDDETLGCGGTILKHIGKKDKVHWLIMTNFELLKNIKKKLIIKKNKEILQVKKSYNFKSLIRLNFEPAKLDLIPKKRIIEEIQKVVSKLKPNILYIPYAGDAHSDHKITFEASCAISKSFRNTSIKKVIVYETPSETDFNLNPRVKNFKPNLWVDITKQISKKLNILKKYKSEIGKHPFPRSLENIKSYAKIRGSVSGHKFAESFQIIKEIL